MNEANNQGFFKRFLRKVFGEPKDFRDKAIFHKLALFPLLAWIGLGADGLSSSAYGPEEAFRALGEHVYLSVFLGLATALTVFIISYAYSRIIEHFPFGGGGYIVATHMIGKRAGVVSGASLIVDYILTIAISIASCTDAIFSFLPPELHELKLVVGIALIVILIFLNIRGVKESVLVLAPIFLAFIFTHAFMITYGVLTRIDVVPAVAQTVSSNLARDLSAFGTIGVLGIFLHAYSLGAGTYTGIEAVSNGLQIMREPRVKTGKRTMLYMATSLAFTAMGLIICYLLFDIKPVAGRTLNSVLADLAFGDFPLGGALAFITILSEGALLVVAAQAGFIDGPRVIANMAIDSWFPHRFAALSDRLTTQNGIIFMGVSALLIFLYTYGSVSALIVMYSINVFITFSLSQFGMSLFYIRHRAQENKWARHLFIHLLGLVLCVTILSIIIYEKFAEGGWVTVVITLMLIGLCNIIRNHYEKVNQVMAELDKYFKYFTVIGPKNMAPLEPKAKTAIQLVNDFNGFGVHTFLSTIRTFPNMYQNFVFASVGVIGSGQFKSARDVEELENSVKEMLGKYVDMTRKLGIPAEFRYTLGTDVVESAVDLCESVIKEFPNSTVFTGQLTFRLEKFYHRMLHNETAFEIQRRLQWEGITTVILPVRVEI